MPLGACQTVEVARARPTGSNPPTIPPRADPEHAEGVDIFQPAWGRLRIPQEQLDVAGKMDDRGQSVCVCACGVTTRTDGWTDEESCI